MRRNGFTLIEVLVASVLMGMLVTILTMIFNQSAIAWRTGKAGIADIIHTARNQGQMLVVRNRIHAVADNVLPYTENRNYYVVSPWKDADTDDSRVFHSRGIAQPGDIRRGYDTVAGAFHDADAGKQSLQRTGLSRNTTERQRQFTVGVRSAGPDRKWDTEDDISTWPEEVE